MPAKNSVKSYLKDGYYHIYTRGVEKRIIFIDEQDYFVFLNYLKKSLLPKDRTTLYQRLSDPKISYKEKDKIIKVLRLANYSDEIALISYCLMPNHIHLLVKQKTEDSIKRFIKSVLIRYAMYFNAKYRRVGHLFQDEYKAVLVESEEQLLYLSGYIHRNPGKNIFSQPSSYSSFLEANKPEWLHTEEILPYFSHHLPQLSYQSFVEQTSEESLLSPIADLLLES